MQSNHPESFMITQEDGLHIYFVTHMQVAGFQKHLKIKYP